MLGDMRVFDLGDELLLDCERVALQELFNMINRYKLGRDVELHKRTVQMGLLSVIGPDAPTLAGEAEHDNARVELGGAHGRSRSPPTSAPISSSPPRTATPCAARWTFPDGDEAQAEIVRVEHGRPRYGVDLDDSVIPQEAGLNERAVSFTKGCYVGQETVARLYYRGKPNRRLLGCAWPSRSSPGASSSWARRSSASSARWSSRPSTGRSAWRSSGARPTRVTRWPWTGRRRSSSKSPSRGNVRSVRTFRGRELPDGRSRDRARQPHRRGA